MEKQNGKFFDVSKTREYFGKLSDQYTDFASAAGVHKDSIWDMINTNSWRGTDAETAKNLLKTNKITLVDALTDLHMETLEIGQLILDKFAAEVDDALDARIDYNTLEKINLDYKNLYANSTSVFDSSVEQATSCQQRFSRYGDIRIPDYSVTKDALIDICGGDDDEGGFIFACMKKLEKFDAETLAMIEEAEIEKKADILFCRMNGKSAPSKLNFKFGKGFDLLTALHSRPWAINALFNGKGFRTRYGQGDIMFPSMWRFSNGRHGKFRSGFVNLRADVSGRRGLKSRGNKDSVKNKSYDFTIQTSQPNNIYDVNTLREMVQNYEANEWYIYGYMNYLNDEGSDHWDEKDIEAVSIIINAAMYAEDTILLDSSLQEFTYTTETYVGDSWGANVYTYEVGVDSKLVSKVLGYLNWKTQGKTYSTLSRIANSPVDTGKISYYKGSHDICKGYDKPEISIISFMEDGVLKFNVSSNHEDHTFKAVNMYQKLGKEGISNLSSIGFSDKEMCCYANSIYTSEDIQFVTKLGKARTKDDYYSVAQIDPDKLSNSGRMAFAMYGNKVFDGAISYSNDGIVEHPAGKARLISFTNGMFLQQQSGGDYTTSEATGNVSWTVDSISYGHEYYILASTLAKANAEKSAEVLETYLKLNDSVDEAVLQSVATQMGTTLEDVKTAYSEGNKSLLRSYMDIQQSNYDYLTYLAGLQSYDSVFVNDYNVRTTVNENLAGDIYNGKVTTIDFDIKSNGRLSIEYNGSLFSKINGAMKQYSVSSEMTGEQLDDMDRLDVYYSAVEEYKTSLIDAGFDTAILVAEDYLKLSGAGVATLKVLSSMVTGDADAAGEAMEVQINDEDLNSWITRMVDGSLGNKYGSLPVTSTVKTISSSIRGIKGASSDVDEAYEKLMVEWCKDGIVVDSNGDDQVAYMGTYGPITTYKWYLFKQDGISMLCANNTAINDGNTAIDSANVDAYMNGNTWDGYSTAQKREVLKLIWNGSAGSSLSFSDITSDQFIDAVKELEKIMPGSIQYVKSATGSSYSERFNNYEVTL
ncbi:hypothetical protein SAMN02910298_02943 [Pseudobutyrivibrio sp. YE44]|uniref:hypothetical protein n=1 Tax=Pseudobutyrivibrio sp. YE44 TaxID=1520802 RepID=UPI00088A59D5|nr:hypothetical protein [Pseudobutyrivibrio sp. YE44]SDB57054.1 hypothetical protein SAMN02910298_02943 [Pseudobutyrivibrio sp. YE44]